MHVTKQMDDAVAADGASSLHRVPHDAMILSPRLQAVAVAEAGAGEKSSRTAVRDLSCGSRAYLFWHVLTTSTSMAMRRRSWTRTHPWSSMSTRT